MWCTLKGSAQMRSLTAAAVHNSSLASEGGGSAPAVRYVMCP